MNLQNHVNSIPPDLREEWLILSELMQVYKQIADNGGLSIEDGWTPEFPIEFNIHLDRVREIIKTPYNVKDRK